MCQSFRKLVSASHLCFITRTAVMRDGLGGVLEAGMFPVQFIYLIVSSTGLQVLGRPVCALLSRVPLKHSTPSRHDCLSACIFAAVLCSCLNICSCPFVSTLCAFCFRIRLQTLKRVCITALYSSRLRLKRSRDCSTEVCTGSFSTRTLQTIHSHWCQLIKIESSC